MDKKQILRIITPGLRTKLSFITILLVSVILVVTSVVTYRQQKNALQEKLELEIKNPLVYLNGIVLELENINRSLVLIEEFKIRVEEKKSELKKFKRTVVSKEVGFLGTLKDLGQSIGLAVKRGNVYTSVDTYYSRYLSDKEISIFESKIKNELQGEAGKPIDDINYQRIQKIAKAAALEKIKSEKYKFRVREISDLKESINAYISDTSIDEISKSKLNLERDQLNKEFIQISKNIITSDAKALNFESNLNKALLNIFKGNYKEKIDSIGLLPDKIRIFVYDKHGKESLDTASLFPLAPETSKKLLLREEYKQILTDLFSKKQIETQFNSNSKSIDVVGRQFEVLTKPVFKNPDSAERAITLLGFLQKEKDFYNQYFIEDTKIAKEIKTLSTEIRIRLRELRKTGKTKPGSDKVFRELTEKYRSLISKREAKFKELLPNQNVIAENKIKWKEQGLQFKKNFDDLNAKLSEWKLKAKSNQKENEKIYSIEEIDYKIQTLESQLEEMRDNIALHESSKDDWTKFIHEMSNDSVLYLRDASLHDFSFIPYKTGNSNINKYYKSGDERKRIQTKYTHFRNWVLSANSETELPKLRGTEIYNDSGILVHSRSEVEEAMWELDGKPLLESIEGKRGLIFEILEKDIIGFNIVILDRTDGIRQIKKNREETMRYVAIIGLFAILLSFIFSHLFVRRIKVISKNAEQIEKGNLNVTFPKAGYDEIGILTDSLNDMVSGLKERDEMRGELIAAEEIQKRLLPEKLPTSLSDKIEIAAFYKAMTGVGGDYYDFIELNDGKLVFCIGDVSNHGVGPAIVMALFRSQIRSIFRRGERNLKKVLLEANASLYEETPDHIFITFFLALFDPVNSQVEYVSAGHIKPLYFDASKNKIHELPAGGLPLGMDENSFFETTIERRAIIMDSSDVFFQYTDGLDEARSPSGDFFTREQVSKILLDNSQTSVNEIVNSFVKDLEKHTTFNLSQSGMSALSDDIAMIAIKKL
ncbi:MAG: SpoIIE family protein phosphatase [Leptospira sp.]|nr:SpoIIE family protein phosphatase [Leptospira sp.]